MARIIQKKKEFTVIIEAGDDGYFVASVPALPGCHTQAKTLSALMKRVEEAIQLCLDVAKDDPRYRKRIADFAYQPTFIGLQVVAV